MIVVSACVRKAKGKMEGNDGQTPSDICFQMWKAVFLVFFFPKPSMKNKVESLRQIRVQLEKQPEKQHFTRQRGIKAAHARSYRC